MDISQGLRHLSSVDDKMKDLINSLPHPIFNSNEIYFSSLVKYLIYQQLSGKAALAIFNRYKKLFIKNSYENPHTIIAIDDNSLKSVGLSKQKILYIKNVANFFIDKSNKIDFSNLSNEQIRNDLITIKGVGPWTIDMFLMFTLGRPDIMPFNDLGIQKGFMHYYNLNSVPTIEFMKEKSTLWKPFRTLASIYLWHLIDDGFEW